jgi:hypothetical protein
LQFGRTRKGLIIYVDSNFATDLDKRRSLTGYVFIIRGCDVSWRACLQSTVAQSTTEVEYIALCDACKEAVWLKGLYAELSGDTSWIDLFCNTQSPIYLTKDPMSHERTNHIDVKYHYVREVIAEGRLKVPKISTHDNSADLFSPSGCLVPIELFFYCFRMMFTCHMPQDAICLKLEIVEL